MFEGFTSLQKIDGLSMLDTENTTNMSDMFKDCTALETVDVSSFDTANVKDMSGMFQGCESLENVNVSNFETENVTTMKDMFSGCTEMQSVDVSNLNTENVTDMSGMFQGCESLKEVDVSNFETENVTTMKDMFSGCTEMQSVNVSNLNTENVTDMSGMFENCENLTTLNVSNFSTESATTLQGMFSGCTGLESLDISGFTVSENVDTTDLFTDCGTNAADGSVTIVVADEAVKNWVESTDSFPENSKFVENNIPTMAAGAAWLSDSVEKSTITKVHFVKTTAEIADSLSGLTTWEASDGTGGSLMCALKGTELYICPNGASKIMANANMASMFENFTALTSIDGWALLDTSNATTMNSMFAGCTNLTALDLTTFDTTNVTDMAKMFYNCAALATLNVSSFNTAKVTTMESMFEGCSSLATIPWSTGASTAMLSSYSARSLAMNLASDPVMLLANEVTTGNFSTANVTSMKNMFAGCSKLTGLSLNGFDTSRVKDMSGMFKNCSALTSLSVGNFVTNNVTTMANMFYGCAKVTALDVSKFTTTAVTDMSGMFQNCSEITSLALSGFNTAEVTTMANMFNGCSKITSLDLQNFNTTKVSKVTSMFTNCGSSSKALSINVTTVSAANLLSGGDVPSYGALWENFWSAVEWTETVTGADNATYGKLGSNVYRKLEASGESYVGTNTYVLAGQDRTPGSSDDNLLSGRTTEMGGSIAMANLYPANANGGVTAEAYYIIKGANTSYYVTAGSDGLLGTWDDIIKDSSDDDKLGTYDINANDTQEKMGWVFVKGSSVSEMLLASEYVLDNTVFNPSDDDEARYGTSTLYTTMASIYAKTGGTKTAILKDQSISMADYTGTVTYIGRCTMSNHTDSDGYHTATGGCTHRSVNTGGQAIVTSAIKNQSNVTATFFALSMQEIAEAYNNDEDYNVSVDYRRAKYADCGSENNNNSVKRNGTEFQSANYWLRSQGHLSCYASYVPYGGTVLTYGLLSSTERGARPACYASLVS
jgi:surface protein